MVGRLQPCLVWGLVLVVLATTQYRNATAAEPEPKRGVYVIWLGNGPDYDPDVFYGQPYIRGGQIVLQWADVHPGPAQYDFSEIDARLADLARRNLYTTIQINGNDKPDWLFGVVPYVKEKLSVQVGDKQGTLMYWHPAHRDAYLGMLEAFAAHMAKSPHKDTLLGIRMNFNANGTEHHAIPQECQGPEAWILPQGMNRSTLVRWTLAVGEAYLKAVTDTYVALFRDSGIRVFVRNGISEEQEETYRPLFESGALSWFHTSSEAEPRSGGTEFRYRRFYDDCRSGKTIAYAEPWASAWGHHGGLTDDRWCSPPQWNYWRVLLDLHCGVACVAIYANDMRVAVDGVYRTGGINYKDEGDGYREEFRAAFDFAAKYAGYHASPEQSPGAWVAFRENDTVRAANDIPEERRRLEFFNTDYDFLMRRLPGDASRGQDVVNVGPDSERFGAWARVLPAGETMRLALDPRFAASMRDGQVRVNVTYFDDGQGDFEVALGKENRVVTMRGTGRWATFSVAASDTTLQADDAGAHIQIHSKAAPITLHMVEVERV